MFKSGFLGAWSDRFLAVTEDIQPTIQEELEAQIDNQLDTYRRSNLSPFFVMHVQKGCDSPSIAMVTSESVWNNRSMKVFLLQHNTPSQLDSLMIQLFKYQTTTCCVVGEGAGV